ncbi:MAG: hypothetical protein MZU97_19650 [Bacillus subtilis]|nr:hypothetical protein [Bacillus subtilis]
MIIAIASELDQDAKNKWGLGSSGALVVGMIGALMNHYGRSFTPHELYRLAVLAEIANVAFASFGDLAVSSFGSAIRYHMPSRDWLIQQTHSSIRSLLGVDWPELVIEPLHLPLLPIVVVHSNQPASSHALVRKVVEAGPLPSIFNLLESN